MPKDRRTRPISATVGRPCTTVGMTDSGVEPPPRDPPNRLESAMGPAFVIEERDLTSDGLTGPDYVERERDDGPVQDRGDHPRARRSTLDWGGARVARGPDAGGRTGDRDRRSLHGSDQSDRRLPTTSRSARRFELRAPLTATSSSLLSTSAPWHPRCCMWEFTAEVPKSATGHFRFFVQEGE